MKKVVGRIVVQSGVGRMERKEGCRKKEGGLQTCMNEHSQPTWQQRALKGGGPVNGLFVIGLETEAGRTYLLHGFKLL